jgi:hypothetical protein
MFLYKNWSKASTPAITNSYSENDRGLVPLWATSLLPHVCGYGKEGYNGLPRDYVSCRIAENQFFFLSF